MKILFKYILLAALIGCSQDSGMQDVQREEHKAKTKLGIALKKAQHLDLLAEKHNSEIEQELGDSQ